MQFKRPFYNKLSKELDSFLSKQLKQFPENDSLRIDLHVKDENDSDASPKTKELLRLLKKHGCNAFTITNSSSAKSCRELQAKGKDILTGAEFACNVPDFNISINVLVYGFTETEEDELQKLQTDLYAFLRYAKQKDIPVIWANPLEYGKEKKLPSNEFLDKMLLVFENFEILNGQSSIRQSLILKNRIEALNKQKIDQLAKKFRLNLTDYCRNPYVKNLAGGSQSFSGMFAGDTGTIVYIKDLKKRLKGTKRSLLVLEALRNGNFVPFGEAGCYEQGILDNLCSAARKFSAKKKVKTKTPDFSIFFKDDLTYAQKAIAFISSIVLETAKKEKGSVIAAKLFLKCLNGSLPKVIKYIPIPKKAKGIAQEIFKIADLCSSRPKNFALDIESSLHKISFELMDIAFAQTITGLNSLEGATFWNFLSGEIMRSQKKKETTGSKEIKSESLTKIAEKVKLPMAMVSLLVWANMKAMRSMNNTRVLLDKLSATDKKLNQPKRMLWVSDTFEDSNGIAMVLQLVLTEVKRRNLPIDIMICSSTVKSSDHLIVIPPNAGFTLPFYPQQPFRLPNVADVQRVFLEGEYDRIISSTEGPMGIMTLYLKHAFSVPAYFYLHSDWVTFGKDSLKLSENALARGEQILRDIYSSFDSVFVLNSEQKAWLTGNKMGFSSSNVFQTAHWADPVFKVVKSNREKLFGVSKDTPLIIFAGRVSEEKGVMELPIMYRELKKTYPNIRMAIIGMGPADEMLRKAFPEAIFTGWVNHDKLPEYYCASDILLLPSRFDTFGCVVIESISCGCPVIAYDTKGPKDILEHGKSGMLVSTQKQMIELVKKYLASSKQQQNMRKAATKRAKKYNAKQIIDRLIKDAGM